MTKGNLDNSTHKPSDERVDNGVSALEPPQEQELRRLKAYFPYRICYAAKRENEFICSTAVTKRRPNDLVRQGYQVWLL